MGKFKKTQQKDKKEKQANNRKKIKKKITKIYKKSAAMIIGPIFYFWGLFDVQVQIDINHLSL
ncbi:MAG: hypothetical protein Q8N56_01380 [bacterium]|nr:hypothetical protein [bacterium]